VGIIGRNGAGKTTLLKILSRITEPTEGHAEIYGRVGSLLEVGTGFHPELTGRENIYLSGAILGMKRAEIDKKFDEIVDFAEIYKFLDTPAKRYSSGMYVRLAFAVAAHLEPEILLVDEVLAVGDIEFQKKCIGKMGDVTTEGKSVLVVSHNMSTVKYLCGRAILLDNGSLTAIGPVDTVVASYLGVQKPDESEKIVDADHHVTGVNRIRVRRIRLLNPATDGFSVYWGQPISVSVDIEVLRRVGEVSLGAGIWTQDGTPVLTVHNDDGNGGRWTLEPGTYTIEFTLRNELRPGLYKLGIGAHERYVAKNVFYVPEAAVFEVLDFSTDGRLAVQHNAGLVNGYATWQTPRLLRSR
jgi:lipopolysaccharide transport system ATP-binding protein